ncbi:MAG TPA: 50S ribosomal protein L28 [Clostridiales bacterium]|jgi:large subunit ribosomal protein L28|nr:50S ribosomal protein L28 [Clostridiales bacterium]
MGKFCEVCQKGAMSGNKVSHSNRKSGRFLYPNVQSVRALVDNKPQRLTVCTRCLRSGKVVRALPREKADTAEA